MAEEIHSSSLLGTNTATKSNPLVLVVGSHHLQHQLTHSLTGASAGVVLVRKSGKFSSSSSIDFPGISLHRPAHILASSPSPTHDGEKNNNPNQSRFVGSLDGCLHWISKKNVATENVYILFSKLHHPGPSRIEDGRAPNRPIRNAYYHPATMGEPHVGSVKAFAGATLPLFKVLSRPGWHTMPACWIYMHSMNNMGEGGSFLWWKWWNT